MGHFLQVGLFSPNLQRSSLAAAYCSNSWHPGHNSLLPSFFLQYRRIICSTTRCSSFILLIFCFFASLKVSIILFLFPWTDWMFAVNPIIIFSSCSVLHCLVWSAFAVSNVFFVTVTWWGWTFVVECLCSCAFLLQCLSFAKIQFFFQKWKYTARFLGGGRPDLTLFANCSIFGNYSVPPQHKIVNGTR